MKRHWVCLQFRFEGPKRFYLGNGITSGGLKWQCVVNIATCYNFEDKSDDRGKAEPASSS